MTVHARVSLPLMLLVGVAGCKSNNIRASDDDYISQVVGSQGATLKLDDGASVYIPANAITEEREVRLGRVGSGYPSFNGAVATSPVYSIDPMDITFKIAAELAAPATQGTLFFAAQGSSWMDLHGAPDADGHIVATSIQAGFFAAVQNGDGKVNSGMGGGPNTDPQQEMGDGTLVRSDLPQGAPGGMAFGSSYLFFPSDSIDQFGQMSTTIKAMPLGSMDPVRDVATVAGRAGGQSQIVASGDYVYWMEQMDSMGGPPPAPKLNRATPGGAIETIATAMQNNLTAHGGSLFFIDQSMSLALYDSAAGMLDPTVYGTNVSGSVGPVGIATRSQDKIFFLSGGGQSAYSVWAGPIGSPCTNTGITFPAAASLLGMGATGNNFVIVTNAGTQANVLRYDTTTPGAPQTIASFSPGVTGASMQGLVFDGDDLFATTGGNSDGTSDLIKISLIDGTQTKLGSLGRNSGGQLGVTAENVYVVEPINSGPATNTSALYQWAR